MGMPPEISELLPCLQEAAKVFPGVDPYVLAAICDRESRGGLALGEDCTGDFRPRFGTKYRGNIRYRFFGELRAEQNGKAIYLPHYMPEDGLGWGRGIFQIDYAGWPEFVDSGAWKDRQKSADFAAKILSGALVKFKGDEIAAIASYNAGEAAVKRELEELTEPTSDIGRLRALDWITTGHNYISDVLRRRSKFLSTTQPPQPPQGGNT